MGITKVKISKLNQFNNFEIDFTYPKQHIKSGLPLDKICIVGDNGVGKTTLLKIIAQSFSEQIENTQVFVNKQPRNVFYFKDFFNIEDLNNSYPIYSFDPFPEDFKCLEERDLERGLITNETLQDKTFWRIVLKEYINFDKKYFNLIKNTSIKNKEDFEKKENFIKNNPRIDFNLKMEKILSFFNIKIYNDFIGGGLIMFDDFLNFDYSYATKKIFATSLIFNSYKDFSSIVILDDIENSYCLSVQKELITHYTRLLPQSQFIVSTHSPIISSQFESCERFILKRAKDGYTFFVRGDAPEVADANLVS
jgi:predicted ATPase